MPAIILDKKHTHGDVEHAPGTRLDLDEIGMSAKEAAALVAAKRARWEEKPAARRQKPDPADAPASATPEPTTGG